MRRFWTVLVAAFVPAAVLAASAGALSQAASGDTCTASASGTTYTLHVTIPAGAEQYGFAFRVPGTTLKNVVIPGSNGSLLTQNLAPNTTGAWISDSPLPGSPVVTLTTSAAITGSLMIVPATATQTASSTPTTNSPLPTYLDAVRCTLSSTVPGKLVAFSVDQHVTYSPAARAWHLVVTVPGAGALSAVQLVSTTGGSAAKQVTEKALVQVKRMAPKTSGKYTLTLKPTPDGQAALSANGSIKLKLHVTYNAATGKSGSKILSLTLTK